MAGRAKQKLGKLLSERMFPGPTSESVTFRVQSRGDDRYCKFCFMAYDFEVENYFEICPHCFIL